MTHATATLDQMRPGSRRAGTADLQQQAGHVGVLGVGSMFFTGLIGAYVILRFGAPGEWAKPNVVLNVPLTGIKTRSS